MSATGTVDRYARLTRMIATDQCVILDGATGTELIKVRGVRPEVEERVWGLTALLDAPEEVARVHRSYIDVGCDVICTSTWGLPTALRDGGGRLSDASEPVHWMDVARRAVAWPARRRTTPAARTRWRSPSASTATSTRPTGARRSRCSRARSRRSRPDLILVETLSLVRSSTYATVEALLETGLPVWLSFRRCRQGVCGVYGEHWGGPEGDAFGRAARRFEEMGVGALAINCIPPDHVAGMLSWLRDFTDLPLGVYPNLGYLSAAGWRHEPRHRRARSTPSWRCAGATRARRSSAAAAASARSIWPPRGGPHRHQARPRAAAVLTDENGSQRQAAGRPVVGGSARARDVPARHARDRRRGGRVRPHPGQLPGLEVPLPRGHRRPPALPGRRLRAPAC